MNLIPYSIARNHKKEKKINAFRGNLIVAVNGWKRFLSKSIVYQTIYLFESLLTQNKAHQWFGFIFKIILIIELGFICSYSYFYKCICMFFYIYLYFIYYMYMMK